MKGALSVYADCGRSLDRSHPPIHPTMASSPLSPAPEPEKGWRRRLAVPSLLAPTIDERIEEVERGTFSQHAIETVCFDLRIRRAHSVTGQFARELPQIQDRNAGVLRIKATRRMAIVAGFWSLAATMDGARDRAI